MEALPGLVIGLPQRWPSEIAAGSGHLLYEQPELANRAGNQRGTSEDVADMLKSWTSTSDKQSRPIVINWCGFGRHYGRKLWQRNMHASLNQYWQAKRLGSCR